MLSQRSFELTSIWTGKFWSCGHPLSTRWILEPFSVMTPAIGIATDVLAANYCSWVVDSVQQLHNFVHIFSQLCHFLPQHAGRTFWTLLPHYSTDTPVAAVSHQNTRAPRFEVITCPRSDQTLECSVLSSRLKQRSCWDRVYHFIGPWRIQMVLVGCPKKQNWPVQMNTVAACIWTIFVFFSRWTLIECYIGRCLFERCSLEQNLSFRMDISSNGPFWTQVKHTRYIGRFSQDGNLPWHWSLFFNCWGLLWPNLTSWNTFLNCSWEILSCKFNRKPKAPPT